ncbi:hypothetical protein P378_01850 [Desulforamulus profundi]|uniref:Uncharacterized protein n=1 Tax=Desulforamulus profundi TaxID=1383067 RepID=A0A2C6MIT8_9FIRM|nr:HD-GYP domain-containing protein [Desulforamulus profundi]PHJ39735.1 hypothetical protein P378_01850 [Desulforamulus profundi]
MAKIKKVLTPFVLYQIVIALLGLYLILKAAPHWSLEFIWVYFFWILFCTGTEFKPVTMPSNIQLSVSCAVHISSLILFGWPVAILIATVANVIVDIKRGLKKVIFNISQIAITIYLSWLVYELLVPVAGHLNFRKEYFPAMLLSCLTYVIVNSILVSGIISLSQGKKFYKVLTSDIKLEALHIITLVTVSLLIIICYTVDPLSIIFVILPLSMAHFNFENYIKLRTATKSTIEVLADIIDKRDSYTAEHSYRVAKYCELIAEELQLPPDKVETIVTAARVHDLGKISIPDSILLKNGPLTSEEREVIKSHSQVGYNIVNNLKFYKSGAKLVLFHHERYDGKGYPQCLKGENIPLGARILAVADSYDAMTSNRPYRKAMTTDQAINELINNAGAQFDPVVVQAFINIVKR